MRSFVYDILPPKVTRSLTKFGSDLSLARRKRHLTAAMMSERLGVAKSTYVRVENGARESAAFEYDATWLSAPDRFSIDPALQLVVGPQFHSTSSSRSTTRAGSALCGFKTRRAFSDELPIRVVARLHR